MQEQRAIVPRLAEQFGKLQLIGQRVHDGVAGLPQLEQIILFKAFRGELVPQDPNDEPASVLLERFRADLTT